jgi:hypothetical protein
MKALANLEGGVLPLMFMKLISTEVRPMATPSYSCGVPGCNFEVPEGLKGQGRCLDHYIEDAFQKLDQASDCSRGGNAVDQNTLRWLLVQVDFIVETLSGETAASDPEKHSKLLQLILGIANLNEHVRHQAFLPGHPNDGVPKQHAG